METKGDRARLQVWLPVELLDRIVVAAQEADRPVSREVVRRLEASFGTGPSKSAVARTAAAMDELAGVGEKTRVPPEPRVEKPTEIVDRLQHQIPGVKTASAAFPSVPQDLAGPVNPKPRGGR